MSRNNRFLVILAVVTLVALLLPGCESTDSTFVLPKPVPLHVDPPPPKPTVPLVIVPNLDDMGDLDKFPLHMPSGPETAPPRGWVDYCVRTPDDPGCMIMGENP